MINFAGGIDHNGQPRPMTYRRLRAHADEYTITQATPDGPARLLKVAADMFALGFYSYEFVASAAAWSIFAVEAALRLRLSPASSKSLVQLIKIAKDRRLVDDYLADVLDAGRKIRNNFVHDGRQPTWTFGMADRVIGASFKIIAGLYPDNVLALLQPGGRRRGRRETAFGWGLQSASHPLLTPRASRVDHRPE